MAMSKDHCNSPKGAKFRSPSYISIGLGSFLLLKELLGGAWLKCCITIDTKLGCAFIRAWLLFTRFSQITYEEKTHLFKYFASRR
jgi:hypothetical protein